MICMINVTSTQQWRRICFSVVMSCLGFNIDPRSQIPDPMLPDYLSLLLNLINPDRTLDSSCMRLVPLSEVLKTTI